MQRVRDCTDIKLSVNDKVTLYLVHIAHFGTKVLPLCGADSGEPIVYPPYTIVGNGRSACAQVLEATRGLEYENMKNALYYFLSKETEQPALVLVVKPTAIHGACTDDSSLPAVVTEYFKSRRNRIAAMAAAAVISVATVATVGALVHRSKSCSRHEDPADRFACAHKLKELATTTSNDITKQIAYLAKFGYDDDIKKVVEGIVDKDKKWSSAPAMVNAGTYGHLSTIKLLQEIGPHPVPLQAVMLAAIAGKHAEIVAHLIGDGVEINEPMMIAAANDPKSIELLLAASNVSPPLAMALREAVKLDNRAVVSLLIQHKGPIDPTPAIRAMLDKKKRSTRLFENLVQKMNPEQAPIIAKALIVGRAHSLALKYVIKAGTPTLDFSDALAEAAKLGNTDVVNKIVETGVVIGKPEQALYQSAEQGHLDIVKVLFDKYKSSLDGGILTTAFLFAVQKKRTPIVKMLFDKPVVRNALFDTDSKIGNMKRPQQVVEIMTRKGYSSMVGVQNIDGLDLNNALVTAAHDGDLDTVKKYLVTNTDANGWKMALRTAIKRDHVDIVNVLLPKTQALTDEEVMIDAARTKNPAMISALVVKASAILADPKKAPSVADAMIVNGLGAQAITHIIKRAGTTGDYSDPLLTATKLGDLDVIRALLATGHKDVELRVGQAIETAAEGQKVEIVKLLVGSNDRFDSSTLQTILMSHIVAKRDSTVDLLLSVAGVVGDAPAVAAALITNGYGDRIRKHIVPLSEDADDFTDAFLAALEHRNRRVILKGLLTTKGKQIDGLGVIGKAAEKRVKGVLDVLLKNKARIRIDKDNAQNLAVALISNGFTKRATKHMMVPFGATGGLHGPLYAAAISGNLPLMDTILDIHGHRLDSYDYATAMKAAMECSKPQIAKRLVEFVPLLDDDDLEEVLEEAKKDKTNKASKLLLEALKK